MHVRKICDRIVKDYENTIETRVGKSPKHIRKNDDVEEFTKKFMLSAEKRAKESEIETQTLNFSEEND